jgi:hypothetical protein
MNKYLVLLGTPGSLWYEPARGAAELQNHSEQNQFQQFLAGFFGVDGDWGPAKQTALLPEQAAGLASLFESFPQRENAAPSVVLTDSRASWLASELADAASHSNFLAFYTSPEEFLAGLRLEVDPAQAMEMWMATGRHLLALVRSHRSRVSLLSVEECLAAPGAWQGFLAETFGLNPWEMPCSAEPDPVRLALAKMQALSNPQVGMVLAELDAASHPLAGEAPPRRTLTQAVEQAWHHLNAREKQARADHEEVLKSLRVLESKQRESREENQLLLQQLHQAQEELETLPPKLRAAEENLEKEKSRATRAGEKSRADLKESEARQKEAQEENELLLLQLHQVQEELENYYLENKTLLAAQRSAGSPEARHLQSQGLVLGGSRENQPHRHLDFSLTGVRLGERELGTLRLRLVEHHGRPGLVVFQHSGPPSLLDWQSNGEERGVPFLLVVPQDDFGRKILAAAPASDLILLVGSVRMLAAELENPGKQGCTPEKQQWARVARRFLDVARDVPARIHYDDITATPQDGKFLHFALRHPWTPGKGLLPSLECVWKDHSLVFSLPTDAAPPFTHWPAGEDGKPSAKLALDLNPRGDWKSQRQAWTGFTSSDKELVLLLLAELPNGICNLYEKKSSLSIRREDLTTRADAMLRRVPVLAAGRKPRWFDFAR